MKCLRSIVLTAVAAVLAAFSTGCTRNLAEKVRLEGYEITYAAFTGPRSAEAGLRLEVDNGATAFKVKHAEGLLKLSGDPICSFTVLPDPVKVKGHTVGEYDLTVGINLEEGVSVLKVMGLVSSRPLDKLSVDLRCTVRSHGISKKLEYKDKPIRTLIKQ